VQPDFELPQAFPSISTGIYGYPVEDATHIALDEVRRFMESEAGNKVCAIQRRAVSSDLTHR
jgi:O-acetyl-ADP-ribose deacetylase (regulator of RNase III)